MKDNLRKGSYMERVHLNSKEKYMAGYGQMEHK